MTRIEKHRLGKDIRKLPAKALNRVVEILQPSNFSATDFPESIVVNLEEQVNLAPLPTSGLLSGPYFHF